MVIGTLGKALGSYGAYVCGSAELVELLVNTARPFIFSTALPPPSTGAALAALELLVDRPGLVEQLRRNAAVLREGLDAQGLETGGSRTQIVPVIVGDPRRAMALCERALEGGVFAQAVRPPTVPAGSSRLRLTAMANHSADELRLAARVIGSAARELGIAEPELRRRADPRPAPGGVSVGRRALRHRHRHRGRKDGGRRGARPHRGGRRPPGRGVQARRQRPRRGRRARSRAASPRRRLRAERRPDRPVSLRARGLAAPGARSWRASRSTPAACARAPRAAAAGADLLVVEGVGGFLVPLALGPPAYLIRDLARELGLAVVIAAAPGLGTINHTLLTIESVRAAGLELAAVVLTPWPAEPAEVERSNRDDDRAAGRGQRRDAAPPRAQRACFVAFARAPLPRIANALGVDRPGEIDA